MSEETFLLPLSYAQRRMWFLDQLISSSSTYNIHQAIPLNFLLSQQALEKSLKEIVLRHETLRTTFISINGEPQQKVVETVEGAVLNIINVEGTVGSAEQNTEVLRLAKEEATKPFDLEQGPLARFTLLCLGPSSQVLLITLHHIVSDGWSMQVLSRELNALYTAYTLGRPSPLAELPIQYADFALWQQDWLQGETLDRQLDYWKTQLNNLTLLALPTDHQRPPMPSYRGNQYALNLPRALTQELESLAHQQNVTLFMLLLTAFKTLLSRYANQDDIVVGVPTAGRNRTELEGLIGFFVNVLVMRTDLSGDPSFIVALQRVRDVVLGAFAHEDLPFEMIVEHLQPERDSSRNPLFQVSFQLLNLQSMQTPDNLNNNPLQVERGTSSFDMAVNLWLTNNGIQGHIEYSTDIFDEGTIAHIASNYEVLLRGILSAPQKSLSTLPLLTPKERQQVLLDWNTNQCTYPNTTTVNALFEEQAAQSPEAIALIYDNEQLTYQDLNTRAEVLAEHLLSAGVKPGSIVAIYARRSVQMIVSLLATLKVGAVYAALDPEYPVERLLFILNDLKPAHILGDNLPDELTAAFEPSEFTLQQNPNSAENPAYVMYTSGSTGTPKGVIIPHRAIIRLVRDTNYIEFSADDVFLQFAAPSFDASTFEIWGPLLNGGTLVLLKPQKISILELCKAIADHKVSTLWLTSGLFDQVVETGLDYLHDLRYLLTGGDVVTLNNALKVLETLPHCKLINGYGPTEGTTFTTCYPITDGAAMDCSVPIGRPVANTTVYLLDKHGAPVPVGVTGELFIGGDGLALGYLEQPELTHERFMPDPFSSLDGARLYRTGDIARYRLDGNIEFLGRIDDQVKINGYRIEPGEIISVLHKHPDVREAVIVTRSDRPDDKRLSVYMVAVTDRVLSKVDIRAYLQKHLPAFMIPTSFVVLDHFPLTPNGKIDRAALPDPQQHRTEFKHEFKAPETQTELTLAQIWKELLTIKEPGIHDDFFNECGGHSLLATQLLSRILTELGVVLTLQQFFERPTISGLTELILENQLQLIDKADLANILDELEGST